MTNIPLSATELGDIWQAYQEKTMFLMVLEHFLESCDDKEIKAVLESTYYAESKNVIDIKNIFQSEGAVVSMPRAVEFVENVDYTSGFNLFKKERVGRILNPCDTRYGLRRPFVYSTLLCGGFNNLLVATL